MLPTPESNWNYNDSVTKILTEKMLRMLQKPKLLYYYEEIV